MQNENIPSKENNQKQEKSQSDNSQEFQEPEISNQLINLNINNKINKDSHEEEIPEDSSNKKNTNIASFFPKSEIKEWEQYFFTERVLSDLYEALEYEEDILCLCTPAISDYFYREKNKVITCLDIDRRFDYLPGFKYFDILKPEKIDFLPKVIIVDPPFFKMNLLDLLRTIEFLCDNNHKTKLIFAFVKREDRALLTIFKNFQLKLTKFRLEYRSVDATKWDNYGIYSNFESRKLKFFEKMDKSSLKNNGNAKISNNNNARNNNSNNSKRKK